MKNYALAFALLLVIGASAQNRNHKFGFTAGTAIQHYSGDLGNNFFKFKSCCFGAEVFTAGLYLDKTFDLNISATVGDYGYCQSSADAKRFVPISERCPGCKGRSGMGDLRSRMVSGNIALKYKLNNGIIFNEDSKLAPYLYGGLGLSYLTDRMKRECVTVGSHFSLNAGVGLKYNITEKLNAGYNLGVSCFTADKVYATNGNNHSGMYGKTDKCLQNTLYIGMNF